MLALTTTPVPHAPGGAGSGGGTDPSSILSNLPEGSGPITTIVVAVCGVLAVAVPVIGTILNRRHGPDNDTSKPGPNRAEIDELNRSIGRLETELTEAKEGVRAATARYEAEKERSHDLELQLNVASQRLDRAGDELAEVRAQLAMFLRPYQYERGPARPPPAHPPTAQRPAPRRPLWTGPPSLADEAPTDPIREARTP